MAYREKVESMLSIKVEVVVECAVQSLEQQNAPPRSQGRPKLRQPAQDSKVQKLVGANCKGSQKNMELLKCGKIYVKYLEISTVMYWSPKSNTVSKC